jgi:hypothetical protein
MRNICALFVLLLAKVALAQDDENHLLYGKHYHLTFGAHYDSACLATVSAALKWDYSTDIGGPFVQLTPGVRGGKISIGFGYDGLLGICGPTRSPIDDLGMAAKVSFLQTWHATRGLGRNQPYLGCEVQPLLIGSASIGIFRSLTPSRYGDDWIAVWSVGLGL